MGAGGSAQSVQEHLDIQEACIKKLQAQLKSGGLGVTFEPGDPEDGLSDDSDNEDEVKLRLLARRAVDRDTIDHTVGEEESAIPACEWKKITDSDEAKVSQSKPWLLNLIPPTDWKHDPEKDKAPNVKLELEYIYGYRTRNVRNTLHWCDDKVAVYFAASKGIVHNFTSNTQKFFHGHTDDITSVTVSKSRGIVATGQQGKNPVVYIWDANTQQELAKLCGLHKRAVSSLSFSKSGKMLATLGLDDDNSLVIYDWESGSKVVSTPVSKRHVFGVSFSPICENLLITHGSKHISMWNLPSGETEQTITEVPAQIGKRGKDQAFMTSSWLPDGNVVIGTANGELYAFDKSMKLSQILYAHNGHITATAASDDQLFTGGQDGYVCVWNSSHQKVNSFSLNNECNASRNSIRSLDYQNGVLLVGTVTGSILQIHVEDGSKTNLASFHYGDLHAKQRYGELQSVCEDPLNPRFATVCYDSTLRVWDVNTRECIHCSQIGVVTSKKDTIGGPARSMCWSPDGKWIAVGFLQGSFAMINADTFIEEYRIKPRKRRVQTMRFSSCSKYLAIGGADQVVDIYSTSEFTKVCECKGNTSVVLSIDWSTDSQYIQTSSQDYNLLYFKVPSGEAATAEEVRDQSWNTMTSFLGWDVQGVWPKGSDGSDINAITRSHNGNLLAVTDEYGYVRILNYPCIGSGLDESGNLPRRPHCIVGSGQRSVTNAAWSQDDQVLLTTGGEDLTIFQWKVIPQ
eukprot:TRINITY_DN2316_c4_g1_i1.p1 TRINITY_DN2316_c4_g1~~TRINITY_DN2316_c4_g1_i1.p1  ORF type:complete len:741 (+),score=123.79 TRINITY_DN2316_c4_g1_i1:543-2765(+)